jgi:hypothetical protein
MSVPVARSAPKEQRDADAGVRRVAFVGARDWLDGCAPAAQVHGLSTECFFSAELGESDVKDTPLAAFRPQATVVFDPQSVRIGGDLSLLGVTLGVLSPDAQASGDAGALSLLDRLVTFDPALSGERVGGVSVWRAIPPPVSDSLYADVRPLHAAPTAMAVGESTEHREAMLMPAKHHYDVLQLIHGVSGPTLVELLSEYDLGVFIAREPGGGFGHEALIHLAAGQLLIADAGKPSYGLERNIDYLHVSSPDELVWFLERLDRFPEMYQRIRIRGRLKAEQYRASRVFKRLIFDLLLDTRAFGTRTGSAPT